MRKNIIWIVIGVGASCLWLGRGIQYKTHFRSGETHTVEMNWSSVDSLGIASVVGTPDQPYARNDFERLRTASPKTLKVPDNMRAKELEFARRLPKSDVLTFSRNGRSNAVSLDFQSRGPANIGGRTRALAIDVSDNTGNTILAGGVSGGMWRTTDQGESWTRTTTSTQFPSVVSILQDTRPGNENIWYYGTGEVFGNSADGNGGALFRGDGIYRSVNSGQSWTVIPTTSDGDITNTDNPFRFVNRMVIDTTNAVEDEIYAAVIDGIIRTTDGFQTYEFVLGTQQNESIFTEVAMTSTGRIYATISDDGTVTNQDVGIWKSDDGTTWEEIPVPNGFPTSGFQRTSIGVSPSNENIVYFFRTEASGSDFNLYVYDDTDESMIARPQSALPLDLGGVVGDLSTQNSYDQYIKVHPNNSNIVFLGAVNLYRSMNGFTDDTETQWIGGYSFKSNNEGGVDLYVGHHPDQHELVFFPGDPDRALSANDGGISMTVNILKTTVTEKTFDVAFSEDPQTDDIIVDWEPIDNGYQTGQFYTVAINQNDASLPWVVGGLQDNSTHLTDIDDGQNSNWGDVFSGDGSFTQLTFNSLIVSAQFAQVARLNILTEGGAPSSPIDPPTAGTALGSSNFLFINPILSDPLIPNKVFLASRGEIFYTKDVTSNPNGDDWLSLGGDVIPATHFVTAMDASVSTGHQLVFATSSIAGAASVYRVEDTNSPSEITALTRSNLPDGYINCVAINPTNANDISLIYSNYDVISIFNSKDGGLSWAAVAGNLEENADGSGNGVSVRWMEIMPNGTGSIYLVGTSAGLYYAETLDGNNTLWTQTGETTIGNVVVDMLAIRPIDGFIAVATHGNGVYQANVEVPLHANIYADVSLCSSGSFTVFANVPATGSFTYNWFVNDELISEVTGSAITGPSLNEETRIQVQIRESSSGQTELSNELVLTPLSESECDDVLSTEDDLQEVADFSMYPNPVTDRMNVVLPKGEDVGYAIIGLGGAVVKRGVFETNSLDLSDLKAGTYIIYMQSEGKKVSKKFVKKG